MDFLGHKRSLLQFILGTIECATHGDRGTIADLFSGSGSVSAAFKSQGYRVLANDHLYWCALLSEAHLLNSTIPRFSRLIKASPTSFGGSGTAYQRVLIFLERLPGRHGFVYRNYSPASARNGGPARMYFSEVNAARIDAIRSQIEDWRPLLTRGEFAILVSSLILAAGECSNIAGTYGCYLKDWKAKALAPLRLMQIDVTRGNIGGHMVFHEDAQLLAPRLRASIVYADPPYTKRQYAAYYHVLETIALADEPTLEGSTGLRPWKQKSSPYCFRRKAPKALTDLVSQLDCKHFFLSYNEDGQIPHQYILDILENFGQVRCYETQVRRYKSSALPHKGRSVIERLYHLQFAS